MAAKGRSAQQAPIQGLQAAAPTSPFQFGRMGPESTSQGRFGVDMNTAGNPQWAEWFDQMHGAGVDKFGVENHAAINDPFWHSKLTYTGGPGDIVGHLAPQKGLAQAFPEEDESPLLPTKPANKPHFQA